MIEVGAGNPYGHPATSTVSTLAGMVPSVHRTDRDGEIVVTAGRDGLAARVRTSTSAGE